MIMGTKEHIKILYVEDNDDNMYMLSHRLRRRQFEVLEARDGDQGLLLARTELPNLILMDLVLPGIDGWEASRVLKSDSITAAIPIIALSASALIEDRDKAIDAGCDDFDTKPVDFNRLLGKIEAQLI